MTPQEFEKTLKIVSDKINANICIFNAEITPDNIDRFIINSKNIKNAKENLALILSTYGGDPDASYRMVRFIKKRFKKFYLYVLGYCKSAGTLIALGADEIIMSDFGELGPLDIQLPKEDDLIAKRSGLCYTDAFDIVREKAYEFFGPMLIRVGNSSKHA